MDNETIKAIEALYGAAMTRRSGARATVYRVRGKKDNQIFNFRVIGRGKGQ